PWLAGQNAHTRAAPDAVPARAGLLRRIRELSADMVSTSDVQRAGGKLFFEQRPAGAENYQLFVREHGHDRLLVDPTRLGTAKVHVSLDWWQASPDGSHVVYGISAAGSEDSTLHILRVADARALPERIANTQR